MEKPKEEDIPTFGDVVNMNNAIAALIQWHYNPTKEDKIMLQAVEKLNHESLDDAIMYVIKEYTKEKRKKK